MDSGGSRRSVDVDYNRYLCFEFRCVCGRADGLFSDAVAILLLAVANYQHGNERCRIVRPSGQLQDLQVNAGLTDDVSSVNIKLGAY